MPSRAMEHRRTESQAAPAYYKRCEDEDGVTSYALLDGAPVTFVDDCVFELPNGDLISRCRDKPFAHWT